MVFVDDGISCIDRRTVEGMTLFDEMTVSAKFSLHKADHGI